MANNRFIKIGGGFFRETPQGISAENDPQNLRQLQLGQLPYETRSGTEGVSFSSQVAQPSLVPSSSQSTTDSLLPGGTPTIPQGGNPYDNFNLLLLDALKKAQGVGTAELLQRKRALERASLGRSSETTPEELRTFSPEQQEAIRSGKTSALKPEFDENAYQLEKAQQSIDNFYRVFGEAQKLSSEFAEKMVAPDSVIQNAKRIVETNPDLLNQILSSLPNDKSKQKLIESLDYAQLKKKETTGGLTPTQINSTVNSIAGAFDNEQIVKNYNTANEGYNAIKSIGVDTKSPADDIAFIYAFAKIMDPNSVVREGEYNTIQKYAQTWADNFGFTAQRIFSNTNFLSADAKQKMLNALSPRINSVKSQYENLRKEYQRQVDDAYQGKPRQITEYKVPTSGGEDLRSQVIQKGYDYDGMITKGYSEEEIKSAVGL